MEKCNEIKMEYGRLRQEIRNVLASKLNDEELLRYFMAAALKIWSGNVLYAPAYSELLSAVSGQSYTIEQIMSALGCCGELERKLRVPQFFQELVALDAESGSSHASNVLRMLNDLLVAAALINRIFVNWEPRFQPHLSAGRRITNPNTFSLHINYSCSYQLGAGTSFLPPSYAQSNPNAKKCKADYAQYQREQ